MNILLKGLLLCLLLVTFPACADYDRPGGDHDSNNHDNSPRYSHISDSGYVVQPDDRRENYHRDPDRSDHHSNHESDSSNKQNFGGNRSNYPR